MKIAYASIAVPTNRYSTERLLEEFPGELTEGVVNEVRNLGVNFRSLSYPPECLQTPYESGEPVAELSARAATECMDKAGISTKDVEYLVATSDSNDYLCPGLSSILVPKAGLSPEIKHVNVQGMACSAFAKALELASDHLARFPKDHVLIVVSGVNSPWFFNQISGIGKVLSPREMSPENRAFELKKWLATMEFFLFGDGVASVLVSNTDSGPEVVNSVHVTNLSEEDSRAGYAKLEALKGPFRFAFSSHLDKRIPELGLRYAALALERLVGHHRSSQMGAIANKWMVHTGSRKILDDISKAHGLAEGQMKESYEVLQSYGNLAGASLPFILERVMSTSMPSSGKGVMVGFGWGWSADATLIHFGSV